MLSRKRNLGLFSLATLLFLTSCSTLTGQQQRPCPATDSVTSFLLSTRPAWELSAYDLVTRLRYPILDRHSLDIQLDSISRHRGDGTGETLLAADVLRGALPSTAFPILTSRGGLEKLHTGIIDVNQFIRWPEIRMRDLLEPPNFLDSLIESFGPECGAVAYARYSQVAPTNEYQALVAAAMAGQNCCRTNRCPPAPRRWRFGCTGPSCRR